MEEFVSVLIDEPAGTPQDVFKRCHALEALSAIGPAASEAMPAILSTLVVRVSVDCVLALRVAAAEAVWKVGRRHDLALPFLAWALKDEYWGVSLKAVQVLGEMGFVAHEAIPDLVQLAERRCDRGRFDFEDFMLGPDTASKDESLLSVVATALGQCGRGAAHWQAAHGMLTHIMACENEDSSTSAARALEVLGPHP